MSDTRRWTLTKTEADNLIFKEAARKALAHRQPSNIRGALDIAFFWGLIALSFALLLSTNFYWAACVAAFVLIAKSHNGLLLTGHEASHQLVFRNKSMNDFFGQYFCSAPFGVGFHRARAAHLDHHHYLLTPLDEKLDQQLDQVSFVSFIKHIFAPLFGSYVFKLLSRFLGVKVQRRARPEFIYPADQARADLRAIIIVQLVLIIGLTLIDWRLYPFFWILPLVTLTAMFHNAKGFLDHLRWPDESEGILYTYKPGVLDRLFFGTQQVYHAEHHLFPHVPHYRLRTLNEHVSKLSMVRQRRGYVRSLLQFGHSMTKASA